MGTTLISGAEMIVSVIVGGDVGTTLGSESGMVRDKRDLGGCSCSAQDMSHLDERIFDCRAKNER